MLLSFECLKMPLPTVYDDTEGKITIAVTGFSSIYSLAKCQHPENDSPSSNSIQAVVLWLDARASSQEKLTRTRSKDFAV